VARRRRTRAAEKAAAAAAAGREARRRNCGRGHRARRVRLLLLLLVLLLVLLVWLVVVLVWLLMLMVLLVLLLLLLHRRCGCRDAVVAAAAASAIHARAVAAAGERGCCCCGGGGGGRIGARVWSGAAHPFGKGAAAAAAHVAAAAAADADAAAAAAGRHRALGLWLGEHHLDLVRAELLCALFRCLMVGGCFQGQGEEEGAVRSGTHTKEDQGKKEKKQRRGKPSRTMPRAATASTTRSAEEARLYLAYATPLDATRSVLTYSRSGKRPISSCLVYLRVRLFAFWAASALKRGQRRARASERQGRARERRAPRTRAPVSLARAFEPGPRPRSTQSPNRNTIHHKLSPAARATRPSWARR